MGLGGRKFRTVLGAAFKRSHYVALCNMFFIYDNPVDGFARYLLKIGSYPTFITVNTPLGKITLKIYSHHDMLTINEVFCRRDYSANVDDQVILDFGSNIGISAAYFLTRTPRAHVYLFEPLASNIQRLKDNLRCFEGRYTIHDVAVGEGQGDVEFGFEPSGRYGGVGMKTGQYVVVKCLDSNDILKQTLEIHSRIDILKIDIETLERQVTERIPVEIAKRINKLYVEYKFMSNPLNLTHSMRQYGTVAQFSKKSFGASEDN